LFVYLADMTPQILRLPSPVWRTLFDETGTVLAIETRDSQTRAAAFKLLHLAGFRPVSLQLTGEGAQATLVGMEAVTQGVLLIHGYADPSRPGHMGLWAYHCADGKLLWQGPQLRFARVLPDGILCTDTQSLVQPLLLVEPQTGRILRTVQPGEHTYLERQRQAYAHEMETLAAFPAVRTEADVEFEAWSRRVQALSGRRCLLQIDGLAVGPYEIYTYYEPTTGGYALRLLVAQNDQTVYQDSLLAETQLLSFDPFFVLGNRLVYVREREALCVLDLPHA